jgi:hypothetical protein
VLEAPNCVEDAAWFPASEINYVDQVLSHPADNLAFVSVKDDRETTGDPTGPCPNCSVSRRTISCSARSARTRTSSEVVVSSLYATNARI